MKNRLIRIYPCIVEVIPADITTVAYVETVNREEEFKCTFTTQRDCIILGVSESENLEDVKKICDLPLFDFSSFIESPTSKTYTFIEKWKPRPSQYAPPWGYERLLGNVNINVVASDNPNAREYLKSIYRKKVLVVME